MRLKLSMRLHSFHATLVLIVLSNQCWPSYLNVVFLFAGPSGADIFRTFFMQNPSHQHRFVVILFYDCQLIPTTDTDAPVSLQPLVSWQLAQLWGSVFHYGFCCFANNVSLRLIGEKYIWLPVGTDSPSQGLLLLQCPVFGTLQNPVSDHLEKPGQRPSGQKGFGFPGTYWLAGQQPVKAMICSLMRTFSDLGSLRQPCLTWSSNGLTLQRMSAFFVSSAKSSTINSLKNLFHVILLLVTGTFVYLAQNILILA